MGFEIARRDKVLPGDVAELRFSGAIGAILYGISRFHTQFDFAYPHSAELSNVQVRLDMQNNSGVGFSSAAIKVLMDGPELVSDKSWVDVTALAWIGSATSLSTFIASDLQVAQMSPPLSVGPDPAFTGAALRGFHASFWEGEQRLLGIGASVGALANVSAPGKVSAVGAGVLLGSTGATCSVDGTVMALLGELGGVHPGLFADTATHAGTNTKQVTTGAPSKIRSAAIFLQSFYGSFPRNSYIDWLEFGASTPTPGEATGTFSFASTRDMVEVYQDTHYVNYYHGTTFSAGYLYVALPW